MNKEHEELVQRFKKRQRNGQTLVLGFSIILTTLNFADPSWFAFGGVIFLLGLASIEEWAIATADDMTVEELNHILKK